MAFAISACGAKRLGERARCSGGGDDRGHDLLLARREGLLGKQAYRRHEALLRLPGRHGQERGERLGRTAGVVARVLEQRGDRLSVTRGRPLERARSDEADPRGHVHAHEMAPKLQGVDTHEVLDERLGIPGRKLERQAEEVQPRLARMLSCLGNGLRSPADQRSGEGIQLSSWVSAGEVAAESPISSSSAGRASRRREVGAVGMTSRAGGSFI